MKNVYRVYIAPFDDFGNYQAYQDVTKYVDFSSIGAINSDLDNTEYDIGIYRFSNIKLKIKNDSGLFSDVGEEKSIFKYARTGSLVKVTWETEEEGPQCGLFDVDTAYLSEETNLFIGLLSDEATTMDLGSQAISFSALGRESLFSKTIVPFGTISNGMLYSAAIYALLNQADIKEVLTISSLNISCGIDQAIDSIASLQNKTVQEGLAKLLLASNSVLYVDGDTVIVSPRVESASVAFYFYGQGSSAGPENIMDIKNIKNGIAKMFNYFTWKDTTLFAQNSATTLKYGYVKKEISFDFTTDTTKRQVILDSLKNEFGAAKQEFDLYTPLNYSSMNIKLLSKGSIDYPRVYVSSNNAFPICGAAICGSAVLPKTKWFFSIANNVYYKVIGKSVDAKNSQIRFKLRKV